MGGGETCGREYVTVEACVEVYVEASDDPQNEASVWCRASQQETHQKQPLGSPSTLQGHVPSCSGRLTRGRHRCDGRVGTDAAEMDKRREVSEHRQPKQWDAM